MLILSHFLFIAAQQPQDKNKNDDKQGLFLKKQAGPASERFYSLQDYPCESGSTLFVTEWRSIIIAFVEQTDAHIDCLNTARPAPCMI